MRACVCARAACNKLGVVGERARVALYARARASLARCCAALLPAPPPQQAQPPCSTAALCACLKPPYKAPSDSAARQFAPAHLNRTARFFLFLVDVLMQALICAASCAIKNFAPYLVMRCVSLACARLIELSGLATSLTFSATTHSLLQEWKAVGHKLSTQFWANSASKLF